MTDVREAGRRELSTHLCIRSVTPRRRNASLRIYAVGCRGIPHRTARNELFTNSNPHSALAFLREFFLFLVSVYDVSPLTLGEPDCGGMVIFMTRFCRTRPSGDMRPWSEPGTTLLGGNLNHRMHQWELANKQERRTRITVLLSTPSLTCSEVW